jgi:uncharacterized membrane protein
MNKTLLIFHFLGLSIGAGTGIYMAALSAYAAKMADKAAAKAVMLGPGDVISKVGTVGLVLLLISGAGMVALNDGVAKWGSIFLIKMALVLTLVIYVVSMKWLAARAKQETVPKAAFTMRKLGPVGPLLAVCTIGAAVLAFQ